MCLRCTCAALYTYKARKLLICDTLLAIAVFVNGAKGNSALLLSRTSQRRLGHRSKPVRLNLPLTSSRNSD